MWRTKWVALLRKNSQRISLMPVTLGSGSSLKSKELGDRNVTGGVVWRFVLAVTRVLWHLKYFTQVSQFVFRWIFGAFCFLLQNLGISLLLVISFDMHRESQPFFLPPNKSNIFLFFWFLTSTHDPQPSFYSRREGDLDERPGFWQQKTSWAMNKFLCPTDGRLLSGCCRPSMIERRLLTARKWQLQVIAVSKNHSPLLNVMFLAENGGTGRKA